MDRARRPVPSPVLRLAPEPEPVLAGPFTPSTAAAVGIGRSALDRLVREGQVLRLLRGVYLDPSQPCTQEVRTAAVALVVGARQVVVGRTAAWLHGASREALVEGDGPAAVLPTEVHARTRTGESRRFRTGEVVEIGGVRCTSAVRTATDLGRRPGAEVAQAALDGLLRSGALGHRELMVAAETSAGLPGSVQLRELAARGDGRADGAAETVLRMRWLAARLPTPSPALVVAGRRLALGLPTHRFGAVLAGRGEEDGRGDLVASGWQVLVLDARRVLASDARYLVAHLEREFHQHLLTQTGCRSTARDLAP